jgi:hypothetical protein
MIHIHPDADIIDQINQLMLILSIKDVKIKVSKKQLEDIKNHVHGMASFSSSAPSEDFIVRVGAVNFNVITE